MIQTAPLKTSPPSEKYRKLGMVAQKNATIPHPTIFKVIAVFFPLKKKPMPRRISPRNKGMNESCFASDDGGNGKRTYPKINIIVGIKKKEITTRPLFFSNGTVMQNRSPYSKSSLRELCEIKDHFRNLSFEIFHDELS
jgi:ABC-type sugar transport system ATPase subunit